MKILAFVNRAFLWVAVLVITVFVSSCSSSGDSPSVNNAGDNTNQTSSDSIDTGTTETGTTLDDQEAQNLTRVNIDITVPKYSSNALQVKLVLGVREINADWIVDESWSVTDDFPRNTEQLVTAIFSDNNGSITLGRAEVALTVNAAATQTLRITADQFNTNWDDDSDGVSNLDELIAGTYFEPNGSDSPSNGVLLPVTASVELVADKTFRIRWEKSDAADYYRVLENPDGESGYTAVTGKLDGSTSFYDHRVALHKRVNARYIVEACNARECTQSVQQLIEGNLVDAIGYFKASNPDVHSEFGTAISLSANGDIMAISAQFEDSNAKGVNGDQNNDLAISSGAVYVFAFSNDRWVQEAYIKASNTDTLDSFGDDISLSSDGNTLAVSATSEQSAASGINGDQSDNSLNASGAVYVFERTGGNWQQQAYIKASTPGEDDYFGVSISLSGDGNTLAVGSYQEDERAPGKVGNQFAAVDSGAVYVYQRSNNSWSQQSYLKALNDSYGRFGRVVSLSGDGNTLAISVFDNSPTSGGLFTSRGADFDTFYGAVHVLARTNDTWQEQAFLKPSSVEDLDVFGYGLSLSADGNTLAAASSRSVVMFDRINGNWQEQAIVKASNVDQGFFFGRAVSLSADGLTLVFGVVGEESASAGLQGYQGFEISVWRSGAAYVFSRGDGSWPQQAYVKASNPHESLYFGSAVALSANGDTLAISAVNEANSQSGINIDQSGAAPDAENRSFGAGAVYLY